ncbi:MAG: RIP metalloprotease RseP [Beijerinckiaceae bacterium]
MSVFTQLWSVGGNMIAFLFVLTIVIFFHELGHFFVGRLCGVKVDTFSLGFGPELFGVVDRYGTRWRFGALPLGGYVKFHGDANGASMSDNGEIAAMPADERAVTFFAQNVAKRAAIVAAGPIANFLLAIVIFTGIFCVQGRGTLIPSVDMVTPDSAAAAAGFEPGDLIVSINGTPINSFEEMQRIVQRSADVALTVVVKRQDQEVTLVATPRMKTVATPFGAARVAQLGIEAGRNKDSWHVQRYGVFESAQLATQETWFVVAQTGAFLGGLVTGHESTDQLSGPIRIAEVSGQMAKLGFATLLNWVAFLSISIGLLNLMPIPLLDGGHLLYYAIEAVRGKALDEKIQHMGFRIGLTFVVGLMILATYNDISRHFH